MAYTTIDKGSLYFNTVLYTGNGSTQSITGVGFQPDFTWIKARSTTLSHLQVDSVRGSDKRIFSNLTNAEDTTAVVSSFDSDGFSVAVTGGSDQTNQNSATFASWNWLAGGTASSNTDGTITSSVSVNTTSGFSIVKYTGTGSGSDTVGHGLGVTPDFIIVKIYSVTQGWMCFHKSLGNDGYIQLNTTGASGTSSGFWGTPNSTTFGLSAGLSNNVSGEDTIAYCFSEKKGFSKFGSYTGNGSTDGPFVYTGFKPAWVLQKNTSAVQGWQLQDNKRLGYNPDNYLLQPHTNQSESALQRIDLLSNGFKVRTTDAGQNASGNVYIYAAFSESPLTTSTGIPTTAR